MILPLAAQETAPLPPEVVTVELDDGTYTGHLKNNKRDGNGVYRWKNGDVYDGEYVENKKSGRGTYTWANGDVVRFLPFLPLLPLAKGLRISTLPSPHLTHTRCFFEFLNVTVRGRIL